MLKKLIAYIILLNSDTATVADKVRYALSALAAFAPVAFALDVLKIWFADNERFAEFLMFILLLNAAVGAIMHLRKRTFTVKNFIFKNTEMAIVATVVYAVLEMLRYTVGDNIAGEGFRALIQTMTLLWPASKIIKNTYILSHGKYPPRFIIERLYNFEKNGDLSDMFSTRKTNAEPGFEDFKKQLDEAN